MGDIRFSIDFLTLTYKHPSMDSLPGFPFNLDWQPCAPRNGYAQGMYSRTMRGYIFSGGGERMKGTSHVFLPGGSVATLGAILNYTSLEVVRSLLLNWSPKITRIDLTFDFKPAFFTPLEVSDWYEQGKVETSARNLLLYKSLVGSGDTLYVGAPTSDKQLRIYDKGKESGSGEDHTRMEIECHGQVAKKVQERIMMSSEREFVLWCGGVLKGMISIPEPRYQKWLNSVEAVVGLTTKPQSNIENWLRDQVAPALRREVKLEGGAELLAMLMREARIDPELLISIAHDMIPLTMT